MSDHLKERSVSFEDVIEIEYVERFPVPEPQDCLLHDDWVSAVETNGKWYVFTSKYFASNELIETSLTYKLI